MDLNELSIAVLGAGPIGAAGGSAGANHRHRRAAIDQSAAARSDDHGIGRKAAYLHRHEVLTHTAAADAIFVEDGRQEIPVFELPDLSLYCPAAHLIVEGVQQLLAGGGAGKGGSLVKRAAEAALVAKALRRPVERHAQSVHEINDLRAPIGHFLHGRLMLQEVATVDRIVEMLPFVVALAWRVKSLTLLMPP